MKKGDNSMKTLKTIQTLSKISKVISKIIFIFSIVGLCLCIFGILSLFIGFEGLKLGGVTLQSIIQSKADVSEGTLYATMFEGAVYCVGTMTLAKFAENYFKRELNDGTPFTLDGSKELLRLGILSVCIPLAVQVVSSIGHSIISKILPDVSPSELDPGVSVGIGVALIVISLLCKYGAELSKDNDEQ